LPAPSSTVLTELLPSIIHLKMMSALLQALPTGANLVLLGDKDQLASVEAGAIQSI